MQTQFSGSSGCPQREPGARESSSAQTRATGAAEDAQLFLASPAAGAAGAAAGVAAIAGARVTWFEPDRGDSPPLVVLTTLAPG